jgi:hypothetical protein
VKIPERRSSIETQKSARFTKALPSCNWPQLRRPFCRLPSGRAMWCPLHGRWQANAEGNLKAKVRAKSRSAPLKQA